MQISAQTSALDIYLRETREPIHSVVLTAPLVSLPLQHLDCAMYDPTHPGPGWRCTLTSARQSLPDRVCRLPSGL